jgi:hypothetical protein
VVSLLGTQPAVCARIVTQTVLRDTTAKTNSLRHSTRKATQMSKTMLAFLILAGGLAVNAAGPFDNHGGATQAALPEPIDLEHSPPAAVRQWYYNHGNTGDRDDRGRPMGDCVQVSLGMHGVRNADIVTSLLCWDSPFGLAIRGGSGPSRVAEYCRQRGIRAYNVTGNDIEDTYAWAVYAATTGRGAAIGFGKQHFQFLCGFDRERNVWLVCDNNSPEAIDEYTDEEFRAMHAASGFWIVVLDCSIPPPPVTKILGG